jgi:nicotinamide mononucleotide transporter
MSLLEVAAVVLTLVNVWLTVRESLWLWPTGLAAVALYFVVVFQAELYAQTGLQVVYFGLQLYGWHYWLRGGRRVKEEGRDDDRLVISRTKLGEALVLVSVFASGTVILGWTLESFTDAAAPWADSALSVGCLVAQWMLSRKLLENWLAWCCADVGYVGLFVSRELYLTAGLYGVLFVMAAVGFCRWRWHWSLQRPCLPNVSAPTVSCRNADKERTPTPQTSSTPAPDR